MGLDRGLIGTELTGHTALVERGRLRFFAKAIGETDPVYVDVAAAQQAGHPDLPVPPTFFTCLDMMERPHAFEMVDRLGVDIRLILHAEQAFTYFEPAYAGDVLTYAARISDIHSKKGGALEFAVSTTDVRRGDTLVVQIQNTMVVRNQESTP